MLVPIGSGAVIIENDSHPKVRRRSTVSQELAHVVSEHNTSLVERGCRLADPDQEGEAAAFAGELLVAFEAVKLLARKRLSNEEVALRFGVSVDMARWRMDSTGARINAKRRTAAYRGTVRSRPETRPQDAPNHRDGLTGARDGGRCHRGYTRCLPRRGSLPISPAGTFLSCLVEGDVAERGMGPGAAPFRWYVYWTFEQVFLLRPDTAGPWARWRSTWRQCRAGLFPDGHGSFRGSGCSINGVPSA